MSVEQLTTTFTTNNLKILNYKVIVPVWDSFLYEVYRSMFTRNAYGIKTSKLDLSIENNLIEYLNMLLREIYEIIKVNNFVINETLFNRYLYKKDAKLFYPQPIIYIPTYK